MSDTEKDPETVESPKPEIDEEAEKAARLASAKKRVSKRKITT